MTTSSRLVPNKNPGKGYRRNRQQRIYGVVFYMSSTAAAAFQARLRESRERRQMSQSELAKASGFQPSAVSHFETGKRSPSFENLRRLADALEVTTDYLLGRVQDPGASGPTIQRIFRDAQSISKDDLDVLADMAERLAEKSARKTR